MAELFANTSKAPTSTSVITIGASQYFLFSLMNCQSSLTTCIFDIPGFFEASLSVSADYYANVLEALTDSASQRPAAVILKSISV
jgi:hypothetical protein